MMKRCSQTAAALVLALLLAFGSTRHAAAQGATTAAVAGRVTNQQGQPVAGAQVVVTNTATGAPARVVTRSDGRYLLQGLQPGTYNISVSQIGQATQQRTNVPLTLSQTSRIDFTIAPEAVAIQGITVRAERNAVISRGRTGTATVVSDSAIRRLPTITRDFTDFTRLTPQVSTSSGGTSAGGRNNRLNNIQIDGVTANDAYGLSSNAGGAPGGQQGAKPITLEAIQEFQVVFAPFDIRLGGFTGAGINAVTRSGTNQFHGSLTYFNKNEALVGRYRLNSNDALSAEFDNFRQNETGFSFGGPLVRNKLHFFVAGEVSRRATPVTNVAGQNSDITVAEAKEVADILSGYGYQPGSFEGLSLARDADNLFGRLDWTINATNRFTLRHNYLSAVEENLSRSNALYRLGGSQYDFENNTNSTAAQLNSSFGGRFFNELRVGYISQHDERFPQDRTPSVRVSLPNGPGGTRRLFAGTEQFSGLNDLDQNILEITNDLTFTAGAHRFTVGTRNEFLKFSNLFVRNAFGYYEFDSPAALRARTPSRYEYSYLLPNGAPRAEFDARQNGVYVQDQVDLFPNLTVTAGLRYDNTRFLDRPSRNPAFETAFPELNRRTDQVPESNGLWSPRLGFNWDVAGDRSTQLRGGVGLFAGRAPYVYVGNAYGNTGVDYVRLTCAGRSGTATAPPAYVADPTRQPQACANAAGAVLNELNLANPDFKLPQVFRTSLALDRQLPFGFVGTLEGLYSKSIEDVNVVNLSVGSQSKAADGTLVMAEGRPVFDRRAADVFSNVVDLVNTNENYNWSVTTQLQRRFSENWDLSAAYTYSRARDVNSTVSSQALSSFNTNPIRGNPNDPELTASNFEVPHRVLLNGSYRASIIRRAPTDVSFIYVGESGRPFAYVYNGDINNDASNSNDLIFVPAKQSDIRFTGTAEQQAASWQNLNNFIEGLDCLREQRGQVMERNSCREPWGNRVDVRVAQSVPTLRGQQVQLTMDVLNFGNLLNPRWGINQFIFNTPEQLLTRASSSTAPDAAGRYQYNAFGARDNVYSISNTNSRYQIQLGVRYSF